MRRCIEGLAAPAEGGGKAARDMVGGQPFADLQRSADRADEGAAALGRCPEMGGDGVEVASHADRHGHLVGQRLRQIIGNALGKRASLLSFVIVIDGNQRPLDSEARLQLLFKRRELGRVQVDADGHQTELARLFQQPADLGPGKLERVRDLVLGLSFVVVELRNERGQVQLVCLDGHRN